MSPVRLVLVTLGLLASCTTETQTTCTGILVSETDSIQLNAVPGKAQSEHLHSLVVDTVHWDARCARIDPSDIPQVHDIPFAERWNSLFYRWTQDRIESHVLAYPCDRTYEEWLEGAERTQCYGLGTGTLDCEERLKWCKRVPVEEAKRWYDVIYNPQRTSYFNTYSVPTIDSRGVLSIRHHDTEGKHRTSSHTYATTIHTSSGLEVAPEWAYAGIDRQSWWQSIRKEYEWENYLPDQSVADNELHRGIFAPSDLLDYEFFLDADSVYSMVSLYGAGGSYDHFIPIRAWDPDSLNAYMEQSLVGPATVSGLTRESWIDSARCLHMQVDQIPELHPHGRFAMTNRDIRQFRRYLIGSQDHCCRDNPAEGLDCDEEPYGLQLTLVDFNVHQVDENVVSILLKGTRNWGGTGFFFDPKPITVSAKTGLPIPPPNALERVSLEKLSAFMLEEFLKHPCGQNQEPYWRDSPEDTVLFVSAERTFREDIKAGKPFLIQDGEWHWIFDDHLSLFPNVCHQLWTIPTGVMFEP